MFYSWISRENKELILNDLTDDSDINNKLRIVVANSLGCGTNTKNIKYVVHMVVHCMIWLTIVNKLAELEEVLMTSAKQFNV